ncbi:hypothetical protein F5878DRAFT_667606 [Lentinula raphanica]|uniref:Uncharacterized protein n=1 Tax=Lentinula raphanica TaxID=153919 RepID=A0AA38NVQ4_9AGAR|nr:hypothetical protein F5878DRAFT_667606 [Lentinula raphanica]
MSPSPCPLAWVKYRLYVSIQGSLILLLLPPSPPPPPPPTAPWPAGVIVIGYVSGYDCKRGHRYRYRSKFESEFESESESGNGEMERAIWNLNDAIRGVYRWERDLQDYFNWVITPKPSQKPPSGQPHLQLLKWALPRNILPPSHLLPSPNSKNQRKIQLGRRAEAQAVSTFERPHW